MGIGIVFNDGTAGLIISETSKFEPQVNRSKIPDERTEKEILDVFFFSLSNVNALLFNQLMRRKSGNSLLCCVKCNLSIISLWLNKVIKEKMFSNALIRWFFSSSGQGFIYYIDDLTASLQLAHKIQLSVENFPGLSLRIRR